jgi:four helix bundle protein
MVFIISIYLKTNNSQHFNGLKVPMNNQKKKKKKEDIEKLRKRIYDFVIRIVNLVKQLPNNFIGNRIGGQLLDAGTSVGANFEEACAAFSKADFIHKISIAKKEAYEANYWLRVIRDTDLLPRKRMGEIITESEEIKRILTSSLKTAQENPESRGEEGDEDFSIE